MVLSTTGYKSLAKKFENKRGRKHDVKQLKNKYANLKKYWTAWIKLMDRTKGIIGIGFDNETGLFQAFDEWWERMETINKTCVKFKMKPLEHCELMEIVFTGAAVTDKHHWTLARRLSKITSALLIQFRALVYGHSQIKSLQLGLKWRLNRQWKVLKWGEKEKDNHKFWKVAKAD